MSLKHRFSASRKADGSAALIAVFHDLARPSKCNVGDAPTAFGVPHPSYVYEFRIISMIDTRMKIPYQSAGSRAHVGSGPPNENLTCFTLIDQSPVPITYSNPRLMGRLRHVAQGPPQNEEACRKRQCSGRAANTRQSAQYRMSFRGRYLAYDLQNRSSVVHPPPSPLSAPNTRVMAAMDIEMTSPVGPLVAVAYDQDHAFGIPAYQPELDLCQLLQSMSLTKGKFKVGHVRFISGIIIDDHWRKVPETGMVGYAPHASQSANEHDAGTEDPAYHSDASESSSSKSSSSDLPHTDSLPTSSTIVHTSRLPACHFLQSILASLVPDSPVLSPSPYPYPAANAFQTTNGVYLDTLLLHRGLLAAFPPTHQGCATALHEIARAIEVRAWRADRDSDAEAVAALRQEAYIVAHWV
ncbi:hypothetical protein OG21DRAFT_1523450 [Imleria badia]|nr:hypothetical protein OG21DRAFT_1523450 [Imleria badia]